MGLEDKSHALPPCFPKLAAHCFELLAFPGSAEASVGGGNESSFIHRFHGSNTRCFVLSAELNFKGGDFLQVLNAKKQFPCQSTL